MQQNLIPESFKTYKFENTIISIFIEQKEEHELPFRVCLYTFSSHTLINNKIKNLEKEIQENLFKTKSLYALLLFKIKIFLEEENINEEKLKENIIYAIKEFIQFPLKSL